MPYRLLVSGPEGQSDPPLLGCRHRLADLRSGRLFLSGLSDSLSEGFYRIVVFSEFAVLAFVLGQFRGGTICPTLSFVSNTFNC
jgi:hypothetical protein